jgi:hypothetical protein
MRNRFAAIVIGLALVAMSVPGQAQSAEALVGTWEYVSGTSTMDGKSTPTFGTDPRGRLVMDKDGNWVAIVTRGDLPRFASNDRLKGTPEEYKAINAGMLAYFGQYTVNTAEHLVTVKIMSASIPNWNGQTQTRKYDLAGDTLTITTRAVDGGVGTIVWKRMAQK